MNARTSRDSVSKMGGRRSVPWMGTVMSLILFLTLLALCGWPHNASADDGEDQPDATEETMEASDEEMSADDAPITSSDDEDDEDDEDDSRPQPKRRKNRRKTGGDGFFGETGVRADPVQGIGTQGQLGYIVGPTLGRNTSIAPVEMFPYIFMDNHMIFNDTRLFMTNNSQVGANVGLGYRNYNPEWERVFGVSGWYDGDHSTKTFLQQLGLSLEALGDRWDLRSNLYLPVGNTQQQQGRFIIPNSLIYSGNNVLYDQERIMFNALKGVDAEAGIPIGTKFGEKHNIRVYGGGYFFPGNNTPDVVGWKGRIEFNVNPEIPTYVQITSDRVYNTNVIFGFSYKFGQGRLYDQRASRKTAFGRIGEFVRRNYNVIAPSQTIVQDGVKAINPATGQPYVIEHVDSSATGTQDGSITNPFATIAQAQAAGGDIILVHAGSVFTGANAVVDLTAGERLLGDAVGFTNLFNVSGFGNIVMPHATNGTIRPELQNAAGDAVTLASNSQLSNFVITSPSGNGIVANAVTNATVTGVSVTNAGADGVQITNSAGNFVFAGNSFVDAAGSAFHVNGGNANILVSDTISNSIGQILTVENTTGGFVSFTGSTVSGDGGKGIVLNNDAGAVTIDFASITNTNGAAITINGGTGLFAFTGTTTITNPSGIGVDVEGLAAAGIVNFANLAINGRNDVGINFNNVSGAVNFLGNTNFGTHNGGTGAAIQDQNSPGTIAFNNVTIADSGGAGILVGNNLTTTPGVFLVAGTTAINQMVGSAISILNNNATVQFADVGITNRSGEGITLNNNTGSVAFVGITNVGNELNSGSSGIDIQNSSGSVGFVLANVGASTGAPGVILTSNTGFTTFDALNVVASSGEGLNANNGGTLIIDSGAINTVNGTAVDIQNTALNVALTSISVNNATTGISLVNTTGQFVVTGDGVDLASGGLIQNTTTGILLNNARNVGISFMDIGNNQVGLSTTNTNNVQLEGVRITDSTTYGIDSLDTASLKISDSLLQDNGASNFNSIRFRADNFNSYGLTIASSSILGGTGDSIGITTTASGAGATLGLSMTNSVIANAGGSAAGVRMNWSGPVNASFSGNTITGTGGSTVGLALTTSSTTDPAVITINNNNFASNGGSDTGVSITGAGPTNVSITQNTFGFGAVAGVGMNFALSGASTVSIASNFINDTIGGGTGILFSSIGAPSSVNIDNSLMNMSGNASLNDRGIIFTNVSGLLTLSGTENNQINGAATPFSVQPGTSTGQIIVNGNEVP